MVVGGRELIDTLWNVNQEGEKYIKVFARGINRYIMECKYHPFRSSPISSGN